MVGAGVGGLAAAARLAATGPRVHRADEQAPRVGGKLGVARAATASGSTPARPCSPCRTSSTSCSPTPAPPASTPDPGWSPSTPPAATASPTARARRAARPARPSPPPSTPALGPGAGAPGSASSTAPDRSWEACRGPFLSRRSTARAARLRCHAASRPAAVAPGGRCAAWAADLRDPRLRVSSTATPPIPAPTRAGARGARGRALRRAAVRGLVRRGGLRRLAEALARSRASCAGARSVPAPTSRRCATAAGRVAGVRLADGERLPADVVVANADAVLLYEPPWSRRPRRAGRAPRRATPSLSGFVAAARRSRPYARPRAPHGALPERLRRRVRRPVRPPGPRPVRDPTVYVSAPDDPALRPDATEAWFVLVNAPPQGQRARRLGRAGPPRAVRRPGPGPLAARGLDVARPRAVRARSVTPSRPRAATRAPGGAIYGTASHGARAAFLRPANRSPVPGLFLVGGSSHPGGGLPLVALSAAIVADMVGPA